MNARRIGRIALIVLGVIMLIAVWAFVLVIAYSV
jgi:hypothetical protein